MSESYAAAGVDTGQADAAVDALVGVLRTIELDRPSLSVLPNGHYASVLRVAPNLGIAISTDGVGSKIVVAEQADRLETVGIDCIAMNVNDLVCVGAEPIAMLDYLAVEQADPQALARIALGLKVGAQAAGIEIPGGELAVLPELIRGHPSPHGFDLCGTAIGTVALDARPALLEGRSVADALLEPTVIYVRAALDLLRSDIAVNGLAHITGGGLRNLLRLGGDRLGFAVEEPLPVPPICALVAELGAVPTSEMWDVFNMGCGFVAIVPEARADDTVALLATRHPGTARIGTVTADGGRLSAPGL